MANAAPALLGHCQRVYDQMMLEAEIGDDGFPIYTGALTRLFSDLGLSTPYYTHCTQAMMAMDCIRQVRRGGGGQGSVWMLLQEPTEELFKIYAPQRTSTENKRVDEGEQQMRIMNSRIAQLESRMAILEAKVS